MTRERTNLTTPIGDEKLNQKPKSFQEDADELIRLMNEQDKVENEDRKRRIRERDLKIACRPSGRKGGKKSTRTQSPKRRRRS